MPKLCWYFAREHVTFVKRRTWHTGIESTPYFKWNLKPFNYELVRIFGTLGFRYLQQSGKLVEKGSHYIFLVHGSNITTTYSYSIDDDKWFRSPFFRFDTTFSSVPSHSLPLSFRNMLGAVKLDDVSTVELNARKTPYAPDEGFTATVPLQHKSCPLNITVKDDSSFNTPILHTITQRHPWRNHLPS